MLTLLSPAKTLDETSPLATRKHTEPRMLDQTERLVTVMRGKSVADLRALMGISEALAVSNHDRFQDFTTPFRPDNARPAVLTFAGDVYTGMDAPGTFDERDFTEANKTVRILSGLYGLLRPLDLVQPYRLEMGTKLATDRGATLYDFWGQRITDQVVSDLVDSPGTDAVVNLASDEYASAVDLDRLDARVIAPRFLDEGRNGELKVISFWAKRARGTMAGWLVRERVRSVKRLTAFAADGYRYDPDRSSADQPTFVRTHDRR